MVETWHTAQGALRDDTCGNNQSLYEQTIRIFVVTSSNYNAENYNEQDTSRLNMICSD